MTRAALGTPRFYQQRAAAVSSLDRAQDLVGGARLRSSDEEVALRECLIVALRCGEVISYLEGKELRVDASVPLALRDVAQALDTSTALEALATLRELPDTVSRRHRSERRDHLGHGLE